MKELLSHAPKRLLGFGAGIGHSLPHFLNHFPKSQICATDISKKSLEYLSNTFPHVTVVQDDTLEGETFDLIFLSGGIHHIPPEKRPQVLQRLRALLCPAGHLVIFEHNPYNPVTQRMVATCPFDKGVKLLTQSTLKKMMGREGLRVRRQGYALFFPEPLKILRPTEKNLRWCPLGGQYFVMAGL